jgi:choline dehydrogenase-like flavoprotein
VTYRVSGKDKRTLTKGLIQAYHMLAAAGATRLVPPQFGLSAVDIDPALGTRDPRFVELMRTIETEGVEQSRAGLFSAHQMGTCRMHGVKSEGVVRPTGESWDVGNLYICDASVFPTSSGVNPMLTVLAMSQCIAAHANRRLELLLAARSAPRSPYIAAKL